MVAIHLTFVVSGVLLALMDWITSKTERDVCRRRNAPHEINSPQGHIWVVNSQSGEVHVLRFRSSEGAES